MEANTAFIGTDSVVVLYAVAHVGSDVAFIVHPSNTELIYTVGNAKALNQVYLIKFRVFVGSGGFPLFIVLGEDGLIRYMVNGTNEKIRQDILNVINK